MLKVGLTGGIACGKSMVADLLVEKGALLIDSDQLARDAVTPGAPAWQELRDWLGESYFLEDGSLNRQKTGALVFASAEARERLNAIIHPRIIELFQRRSHAQEKEFGEEAAVQVWDAPLLFEVKMETHVDLVLVVAAMEKIQVQRLCQRDGLTAAEALQRIRSQMSLADKMRAADYIIYNNGTKAELRYQVERFWETITDPEFKPLRD